MRTSAAVAFEASNHVRADERKRTRVPLSVLIGDGLDARVREGISTYFAFAARIAVAVIGLWCACGLVMVMFSVQTAGLLHSNQKISQEIQQAQNLRDQLKIERSVLSSNARIGRIATQNYGMNLSADQVTVHLTSSEKELPSEEAISADAAGHPQDSTQVSAE